MTGRYCRKGGGRKRWRYVPHKEMDANIWPMGGACISYHYHEHIDDAVQWCDLRGFVGVC